MMILQLSDYATIASVRANLAALAGGADLMTSDEVIRWLRIQIASLTDMANQLED